MLAGVALHLGAVDGDYAELDESSLLAEVDGLLEQAGERLDVNTAKVADTRVVGMLAR